MALTESEINIKKDLISFVENWRSNNNITYNSTLTSTEKYD